MGEHTARRQSQAYIYTYVCTYSASCIDVYTCTSMVHITNGMGGRAWCTDGAPQHAHTHTQVRGHVMYVGR